MDRPHAYALAAIATSAAVAVIELGSVLLRMPWPETTPWWSYGNSILTVGVLVVAAVAMALRNLDAAFFATAWWIGYVAAGYLVVHALTLRVSGNAIALVEIPVAALLILFVRRAMNPADPEALAKHVHLRGPRFAAHA